MNTSVISPQDKLEIKTFYKQYSDKFTDLYRGPNECKNIKKLFTVIWEYIQITPSMKDKYKDLFQYIIPEIPNTYAKNH